MRRVRPAREGLFPWGPVQVMRHRLHVGRLPVVRGMADAAVIAKPHGRGEPVSALRSRLACPGRAHANIVVRLADPDCLVAQVVMASGILHAGHCGVEYPCQPDRFIRMFRYGAQYSSHATEMSAKKSPAEAGLLVQQ